MTDVCEHGSLRRACLVCELREEVALHGQVDRVLAELRADEVSRRLGPLWSALDTALSQRRS